MRPSWIEVDLDAVTHNVATIARVVAPSTVCAVVKADGYGHGDVPVARASVSGGARWLAVALVEEAVRLRDAGVEAPILLLSEGSPTEAPEVVSRSVVPTVYRPPFVEAVAVAAAGAGRAPYPVHLKVDTGMHRVGASPEDVPALARTIVSDPRLELAGVWTHFAVAEEDMEYTKRQAVALERVREALAGAGIRVGVFHAANTAGALEYPEARLDMVRVGLGIYGLRPAPHVGADLDLHPAMRVVSRVAMVRSLPEGARPSYGRRRPMPRAGVVATVPIGYADGVSRRLSEVGATVLIDGRRHPYAGTVTMDQVVVDVGEHPVAVGEEVVLLGAQGTDEITADEWAEWLGTINYEIVCDFGPRLPRRHLGGR